MDLPEGDFVNQTERSASNPAAVDEATARDAARWRYVISHAAEQRMSPIAVCREYRDTPHGPVFAACYGIDAERLVDDAIASDRALLAGKQPKAHGRDDDLNTGSA